MDMIDGLPAIFAGVNHSAISLRQSLRAGDFGGCPMKMADQGVELLASVGDGRGVLARDNKDVHGRLRIDVSEGVALVVLIDSFGWNASIDDSAEETTHD